MAATRSRPVVSVVSLGQRLAARRKTRGLSGQQLATSAELSIDTIRSIESGRIPNPGIITMAKLAKVLGASLDDLAGIRRPRSTPRRRT